MLSSPVLGSHLYAAQNQHSGEGPSDHPERWNPFPLAVASLPGKFPLILQSRTRITASMKPTLDFKEGFEG